MADSCIKTTNLENKRSGNVISLDDIEKSIKGKYTYKNVDADADINVSDFVKADTSGGAITLTLPASPNDNDQIIVWDITGSFNSNNCTIDGNGKHVMGDNTCVLDIDNKEYHIIYDDNSSEWRIA
jgi:hypothetical protein